VAADFRRRLVGRDPLLVNQTVALLARIDGGRIAHTVLSGIEQALWDLVGQKAGLPIHALFGGKVREKIRLYANINRQMTDMSAEAWAAAAAGAVSQGFTAVKAAPFVELSSPDHVRTGPKAAWAPGIERLAAIREAVGPSIDLMVDCHGRMETSEALLVARELEPLGLMWYEEPVRRDQPDQLRHITGRVNTPTASAEGLFAVEGFAPFLRERVVDVLMPDVKHCGGLAETRAVAEAARMNRLLIAPHNPSGPVASMASAHVCATLSNFLILEYAWGEVPWRSELLEPSEPVEAGMVAVPDRPGLGFRLRPDVVEAHRWA
jgi:galactonate dehydratase